MHFLNIPVQRVNSKSIIELYKERQLYYSCVYVSLQCHEALSTRVNELRALSSSPSQLPEESAALLLVSECVLM